MKIVGIAFSAVLFTIASTSFAQSCFLSEECSGEDICAYRTCTAPTFVPLDTCKTSWDCDTLFECMNGVCKPQGVYCETEDSVGTVLEPQMRAYVCEMSSVWAWHSEEDLANRECDPIDVDACLHRDVEIASVDEWNTLYQLCIDELQEYCETEPLVPEEECSEETLSPCMEWARLRHYLDVACEADETAVFNPEDNDAISHPEPILNCCLQTYINKQEEMTQFLECVNEAAEINCESAATCRNDAFGTVDDAGEAADTDSEADSESGSDESDVNNEKQSSSSSGCSFSIAPASAFSLLQLL